MTLKLITLNIEGSRHLARFLPFLKKEKPDVICLQEVFKKDVASIKKALRMKVKFIPMSTLTKKNKYNKQLHGQTGIAYITNLEKKGIKTYYYRGNGKVPIFRNPFNDDRVLVYSTIVHKGKEFTIGTTHFTWTPNGKADKKQRNSFQTLMQFLKKFDSFVLCGDFNAPRGREIYTKFTQHFVDHLPKRVKSTIDPKLHRHKGLQVVIDTVFSTTDYTFSRVRAVSGVSDH